MMRFIRYAINVVVAVVLGDLLARQVAAMVYASPETIKSIKLVLISVGVLKKDSLYDIDGALLLVILVLSIAVVGLIVWAINTGARLDVELACAAATRKQHTRRARSEATPRAPQSRIRRTNRPATCR